MGVVQHADTSPILAPPVSDPFFRYNATVRKDVAYFTKVHLSLFIIMVIYISHFRTCYHVS